MSSPISRTKDYAELCRIWKNRKGYYLSRRLERPCPVCAEANGAPLFQSQDGYPYVECCACGMWYISKYIPDEIWNEYQTSEEAVIAIHDRQFVHNSSDEYFENDRARFGGYFRKLKDFVPKGTLSRMRYLDVGCFTGNSLQVGNEFGMECVGTESSVRAVEFSRGREGGQEIYSSLEELLTSTNQVFDLVSLWETLEHIVEPRAVIESLRSCMNKGSLLALTVPNANSALPLILKNYCFYCTGGQDTQGHLNLFSKQTISLFLQKAGFEMVNVSTIYSTDFTQVFFYLADHKDKIYCIRNLLSGSCLALEEPMWVRLLANAIGPDLSRLEEKRGAGPMLFVIARAV